MTSGGECPACRAKRLGLRASGVLGMYRSAAETSGPLPAAGMAVAAALRETGAPLPSSERAFFESRLIHDLSGVRVHVDRQATTAAREIHAKAFTYGRDVYFDEEQWAPGTNAGRLLLAHELIHVLQQSGDTAGATGTSDLPIQRVSVPTIQRQACEDPDEMATGALPQLLESRGAGEPQIPQVEMERLTFEEFESMTSMRGDELPEDTFVGMDRIQGGTADTLDSEEAPDLDSGVGPAGAAAAMGLTPQVPISLTPANSVGILVTRPHVSIFAKVDGRLTVVGFRGNIFTHIGSQLPGEAGMWFKQQLIEGVPGRLRGDRLFTLMGDQAVIYRETDRATARSFASHLGSQEYGGTYRFTPPDPNAPPGSTESRLAERTYRARGETRAVMKGPRNCITVPAAEMYSVLGTTPTSGGIDLTTGRTASGEYHPHQHGRARGMWQYAQDPNLSRGREGLRSVSVTPRAAKAIGVIRVGGGVMLVYGGVQTGKRLHDAWGTDDFPLVAAQETMTWTGGILGTAAGAAGVSAIVCSPTGPVTAVCAVGGFLGGLVVGTAGAIAGSMVIPVMIRTIEGSTQAILLLVEGLVAVGEVAGAITEGIADAVFTALLETRNSLNPCNWELQQLAPQCQGDINALGLFIWSQIAPADADTLLSLAGQPINSFTVPAELLEDIATGMTMAVQASTDLDIVFTPEFVGGINPPEFVRQLEQYGLLRFKYDPALLAEIQMLPD